MNDLFKKYYYSDDNIYNNPKVVWDEILNDKNNEYTYNDFSKWLEKQEYHQIHTTKYKKHSDDKPDAKIFHTIVAGPDTYQTDIMFIDQYAEINNDYSCIINFVEITTRKAYSYPMKDKKAHTVFKAFLKFLRDIKGILSQIESDGGTEYNDVKEFCYVNYISYAMYTDDKNSMAIVERFNRSLRNFINKVCLNNIWYKKLDNIVDVYNNSPHSTTGLAPNKINEEQAEHIRQQLIFNGMDAYQNQKKFEIGDEVKTRIKPNVFGKDQGKFSNTVHTITSIIGNSIYLDGDDSVAHRYYDLQHLTHSTNNETESTIRKELKKKTNKIKIGDSVRLLEHKKRFDKGNSKFSSRIYIVLEIANDKAKLDDNKKYDIDDFKKISDVENQNFINSNNDIADKYKLARKLKKQLETNDKNISVKEFNKILQERINDESQGRGKREKKAIERLTYK
jgi:hypothetical protein